MGGHLIDIPPPIKVTGMTVRDELNQKSGEVLCGYFDARFADIVDVRGWHLFFNGKTFRVKPPAKIDENRHVKVAGPEAEEAIARVALSAYHILGGQFGR